MLEKKCEDKCPYCDSERIEFVEWLNIGENWKENQWQCMKCGREFITIVDIEHISTYSHTEYEEIPLNERTLFDKG